MPTDTKSFRVSRRTALGLVASGVGTAILAACAPPAPSAPSATVTTSKPAAGAGATPGQQQPRTGGTLRIAQAEDINRLDPHFRLNDIYYSVYDRLTQYDLNHNVQPMLAESWDVSSDWTQIKFNLRKGVQFHNGKELTSEDVKFNSERARDLPNTQLDEAKWWTSIETPDQYTVIFKSDRPRPLAFDFFEFLNIAEPSAAADPTKAVGTGPFKFVEWRPKDAYILTKNPSYWESGKPYLDGINVSIMGDLQGMTVALEGGVLDAALQLSVTDFMRLKDDAKYRPHTFSAGNFACLGIQCQSPPWDNKKARQALLHAVDRERWANTIQRGLVTGSALPWAKSSPAYDEAKGKAYPFDLDKAKSLLQAAGVTGPVSGDVIMTNSDAELNAFAQVVQNDFAKLGITLALKPQEQASYLDLVNNWKYQGFWLGGGSFTQLDPATGFTKSRALSVSGNSSAFTTPANAAAVELVGRATSEPDQAKRKEIYTQLNDMLLDEVYIITMSPNVNRIMSTAKVQNINPTLHSANKWWEVWLTS